MSGRMMAIAPVLSERSASYASASNSASITESLTEAKSIQIDNGTCPTLQDAVSEYWKPIDKDTIPDPTRVIYDYQKESNKPTYSIALADLFPFLKTNQLPLFMIQEQVSIHLTFTPRGTGVLSERVCSTGGTSLTQDCTLVPVDRDWETIR